MFEFKEIVEVNETKDDNKNPIPLLGGLVIDEPIDINELDKPIFAN